MPPHRRDALLPVAFSAVAVTAAAAAAALAFAPPASADETDAPGHREDGPVLLVCIADAEDFADRNAEVDYNQRIVNERLYEDCLESGHRDLDSAVAAVEKPGSRIQILPGRYDVERTIVVDGAENLQIEGLGKVQLSAGYLADAVLEARDTTGLYLGGLTIRQARSTGLIVTDAEGATVRAVHANHNGRTGIHIADSTAVSLDGCSATGNGDAGIALDGVQAEVTDCESTGNLVGLHATGGGEATLEGNRLHGNTTGLVIADTGADHELTATGNAVYDNNADFYTHLSSGTCEAPMAERDWSEGVLCPAASAPIGVGVLVSESGDNHFWGNHIWGQERAAAMVWGDPGFEDETSNRNRFEDNTLGYRDDGQRSRNRLDLWWDGQGEGNCFSEPGALHTTPAALPSCGEGAGPDRLLGEPVKTVKLWYCGADTPAADAAGAGCDWFGAEFTDRLEFQAWVVFAAGLLFCTGAGWLGAARSPTPPPPMAMTFSAIATGLGALLMTLASWSGRSDYEALAIGLWGVGWLLAGRSWFTAGLHALGAFTGLVGGLAVLDAIDRGVWIIPVMPFSPAWMWVLLLPLWLLLALWAVVRPYPKPDDREPVRRTPATVPVYNRFDW